MARIPGDDHRRHSTAVSRGPGPQAWPLCACQLRGVYSPQAAKGEPASAYRTPAQPPAYNFYGRAKLEAERLVRAECERAGCPWTILRPVFLYGPENRILVSSFARLLQRRRLFVIGRGDNRISTAYVDDAARAVLRAAVEPKAHGRIYDVASDEAVTQVEFLNAIADALSMPRPSRHVPRPLAYTAAFVADLMARLPGIEPPFTRATIALMSADQVVDTSRLARTWAGDTKRDLPRECSGCENGTLPACRGKPPPTRLGPRRRCGNRHDPKATKHPAGCG